MSSGLQDARVLSAFLNGIARPYMLGVEQRLTEAGTQLGRVTGGAEGKARLSHAYVETANTFSTTSSTAVEVTDLFLEFTTYGGRLLVAGWARDFYVSTTSAATGQVGFSVDGIERWAWMHAVTGTAENDTFGLAALAVFTVPAGRHAIKLIAKTNVGTLKIRAGDTWPAWMMAVEL